MPSEPVQRQQSLWALLHTNEGQRTVTWLSISQPRQCGSSKHPQLPPITLSLTGWQINAGWTPQVMPVAMRDYFDGLVQEKLNSIANALELRLFVLTHRSAVGLVGTYVMHLSLGCYDLLLKSQKLFKLPLKYNGCWSYTMVTLHNNSLKDNQIRISKLILGVFQWCCIFLALTHQNSLDSFHL